MQHRAALFLLACIPFFTACAIIPISKTSPPPSPTPSAGGGKVVSSVTVKRAQFLMGTLVEITPEAPRVPTAMELDIAAQYVDYRRIHLDAGRRAVFLEKPGMRIDIGGIGKGFAAEKAAAVMREIGATGGLVAVAGDFRVFGRRT